MNYLSRLIGPTGLPASAEIKLAALRQQSADLHAVLQSVSAERSGLLLERRDLERPLQAMIERYGRQPRRDDPNPPSLNDQIDHLRSVPDAASVISGFDRIRADLRRIDELIEIRQGRWQAASQLVGSLESFVEMHRSGLRAARLPDVKLPKGMSPLEAVEIRRRRVRELAADAHKVRSSPLPAAEAKKRLRAEVEALAARGEPDCSEFLEHHEAPTIRWMSFGSVSPSHAYATTGNLADAQFGSFDVPGVLAFLFKDAMTATLEREIDRDSDDAHALSAVERARLEAQIAADSLAVEFEEEAIIVLAASQNVEITRRPSASPEAVLGVFADPAFRGEAA